MSAIVSPRTPPGIMELLPREQIAFQHVLDTIRRGYERFGFLPVETPVFELAEVLLTKSGGETEKQVFFLQSTGSLAQGRAPELAMRFDLTVPLARYVAEHERDLPFPFRRYQIQRVYRGERPQKGRYREFYQCDIDVIGKDSLDVAYDAEMPAVIYQIFTELKVGGFTINFNNRKVLLGWLAARSILESERQGAALLQIDKLDKIGRGAVHEALMGPGVGLDEGTATALLDLVALSGVPGPVLAALEALEIDEPVWRQGLAELGVVVKSLADLGVPDSHLKLNLAISRGLDYYTGTVYETTLNDNPGLGSICSGGRYDNLASHYTKSVLPGVGISIGVTRLFYHLLGAGLLSTQTSSTEVLVTQLDSGLVSEYRAIATNLRAEGINTELQVEPSKMKRQMQYANRAGIRFAVLLGEDEQARGVVTLKDLNSGEQFDVPRAELAERVKALRG